MIRRILALSAGALLVSCSTVPEADRLSTALHQEVRKGANAEISVASLTTFAWDTLFLFGPYSSHMHIADAMGLGSEAEAKKLSRGIESRDDVTLLVFHRPGKGWVSMTHPRSAGDFGPELLGHAFQPAEARFRVRVPSVGSWSVIGPLD